MVIQNWFRLPLSMKPCTSKGMDFSVHQPCKLTKGYDGQYGWWREPWPWTPTHLGLTPWHCNSQQWILCLGLCHPETHLYKYSRSHLAQRAPLSWWVLWPFQDLCTWTFEVPLMLAIKSSGSSYLGWYIFLEGQWKWYFWIISKGFTIRLR